jgi:hypothetical protein
VNGRVSGVTAVADGATAGFTISTDIFELATPSSPGVPSVKPFQIALVGGLSRISYRGDMFADGSITAQALNVNTLSAISANLGSITAGDMRSTDGLMVFDLDGQEFYISETV